jgi:pilus assembly protein CpaB
MSTRTIMVVILALICGASMAIGVLKASRSNKPSSEFSAIETEPVVVALANIERGKVLEEKDIEVRDWPKGLAPVGTLRSVDKALERAAVNQVLVGEVILDGKLSPKNAGRGLAALIPPGMRAFTVTASRAATNVAGFVLPGNKVDVLLNMKGGGRGDDTGGGSTTTLLQAVEVLAVDQRLEAPADNKVDPKGLSSVTLLVTPEQANLLDLGQNMGILTFSLRNPADTVDSDTAPTTVNSIRFRGLPPTGFLDGDQAPSPEMLAAIQNLAPSKPSAPDKQEASIITWRGSQRGRVWLTEESRSP